MISAFGVVHAVSKSQIKPGVFKPISEMNSHEKAWLGRRTRNKKYLRTSPKGSMAGYGRTRGQSSKDRKIWPGSSTPSGRGVEVRHHKPTPDKEAYAHPNNQGGGVMYLSNQAKRNQPDTVRHEMAHLSPKRNPHRFSERYGKPLSAGREEGRADFIARGGPGPHLTRSVNDDFKRGYHEVQGKMAAAQKRRKS